ncbi:MAG: hypothetical protein ACTSRA_19760, partial [Promethearchaeota archaeon]
FGKFGIDRINISCYKSNKKFILSIGGVDSVYYKFPERFLNKVDMVITSPPYIYAGEYLRSSKLELYWLGEIDDVKVKKLTRNKIGHRKIKSLDEVNQEINHVKFFNETMKRLIFIEKKKYGKNGIYTPRVANYFHDMNLLIKKMKKVLKNKGIFAFL